MPYTNIEARRKNQREWVARKRARAKEQKNDSEKCPNCGRELYDIYSGRTKMCPQCGYEVKESEQK